VEPRAVQIASPLAVAGIAAVLVGCSAAPAAVDPSDRVVQDSLAACSASSGYDPKAADLPERALAPGEREWRACARQAVVSSIVPKSGVPDLYRGLVADDERMTDAVEAGVMTRTERTRRLEASIADIRTAETRAAEDRRARQLRDAKTDQDRQRQQDELSRIVANSAQLRRVMIAR
jgi:hypothetical protein